jgi:replicative DNA helicase
MSEQLYSVEAESSLIGACLISNKIFQRLADRLNPSDFFNADLALYWSAFAAIDGKGQQFDAITVAEHLVNGGEGEHLAALGQIQRNTAGIGNVKAYAEIIRDRSKRRRLVAACHEAIARAYNLDGGAVEFAQEEILAIGEETQGKDPVAMRDALKRHVDVLERRNRGEARGQMTGFRDFDKLTNGLRGGQMIVLAARPKMGKTTFAINIAERVANQSVPVLAFSLEMSQEELLDRMVASQCKISTDNVLSGQMEESDWNKTGPGFSRMMDWPLWLDDSVNMTITDIRAKARRVKANHGLGMMLIDYLGLMDGQGENQNLKIADITRGVKKLAKELDVPVILLSQLNRDLEKRTIKKPQLSDLRDSGAIEQDADMVVFLYNEEIYDENTDRKGVTEVIIAAQRSGARGSFFLANNLHQSRFEDCDMRLEDSTVRGSRGYDDFD